MILDKKAACAAVGGLLKAQKGWKQRQCEIECCTDDNCNAEYPSKSKGTINVRTRFFTATVQIIDSGVVTGETSSR